MGMGGPLHMMLRTADAAGSMMMRRSGKRGAQRGFPWPAHSSAVRRASKAGDQDMESMSGKGARRT